MQQIAPEKQTRNPTPANNGNLVGSWFYIALMNADGSESPLNHRQSLLNLKADGTFESTFGQFHEIGTYRVNGNRVTLSPENKAPKTYSVSFGDDGKRTFGLSGKTLSLMNNGIGYKLEK